MNPSAIPSELRALPRWVVHRRKQPFQVNGKPASSTDPATWTTFDAARGAAGKWDGIGFVLADPYCGVDLDACMADGVPFAPASRLIARLASYTEVSPSGNGLHVILRARKPGPECKYPINWLPGKPGRVEVYDTARFFCMTGDLSVSAPVEVAERQSELNAVYRAMWPVKVAPVAAVVRPTDLAARCWAYLVKCPDSISGDRGHDKALRAACECFRFGLSEPETADLMRRWSAEKSGGEPWTEREIGHKIADARAKVEAENGMGVRLRPHLNGVIRPIPVEIPTPPATGGAADLDKRTARIVDGSWSSVPWVWPSINSITQALLPGTVTLVCGKPGGGKSFFMLAAVLGWLELEVPCAIFELEEDRTYHLQRADAMLSGNANMLDAEWVKANGTPSGNAERLDRLAACIYDAPENRVSLPDLADWYDKVAPSSRVVVIDPVTAASAGERRWLADGAFMERVKATARRSETSLVLVTHPRIGSGRRPADLDDLAGGADYGRFSQTVLVLADHDPSESFLVKSSFGRRSETANRMLHIRKARNGTGGGNRIGLDWDKSTLRFREVGVLCDEQ